MSLSHKRVLIGLDIANSWSSKYMVSLENENEISMEFLTSEIDYFSQIPKEIDVHGCVICNMQMPLLSGCG